MAKLVQIYLFLAECPACDPRNPLHNNMYFESDHAKEIYGSLPMDVDFSGASVHAKPWKHLVSGQGISLSETLSSTENSNLLIYVNGHGGDRFSKFQDFDEISAEEIGEAITQLYIKQK